MNDFVDRESRKSETWLRERWADHSRHYADLLRTKIIEARRVPFHDGVVELTIADAEVMHRALLFGASRLPVKNGAVPDDDAWLARCV